MAVNYQAEWPMSLKAPKESLEAKQPEIDAIRCLKAASLGLLSEGDADKTAPYFDFIIQSMS